MSAPDWSVVCDAVPGVIHVKDEGHVCANPIATLVPLCADCRHSADEHGARGYGACRHGLVRGTLADVLGVDVNGVAIDETKACRCKRYRVRPRKRFTEGR